MKVTVPLASIASSASPTHQDGAQALAAMAHLAFQLVAAQGDADAVASSSSAAA